MNVLVLLHRDLRPRDHPALVAAAGMGAVLPLFVADPGEWAGPGRAARQWDFVAEALAHAQMRFAQAGAPLAVRLGDRVEVVSHLAARHRIGRIVSSTAPDARLRAALGLPWEIIADGPAEVPVLTPVPGVEAGAIPPARGLRMAPDHCPNRQSGGDPAALLGAARPAGRGSVGAMERSASRLSAHLAWGTVSMTEAAQLPGTRARLALRAVAADPMPEDSGGPVPAAWSAGETGLPFADACLRYLAATGWLPAPLRAMVGSVAVHLLGAGSRAAGLALARLSTDFDAPLLWQGMAALRPCDPVRLGRRLDPQGAFIRRWLPELAGVPEALVHAPWRWQGAKMLLGRRYPEPLADPATALARARQPGGARPPRRRPNPAPGQLLLAL
ncbi:MAG: FAD-binding domain-containing protein [Paracoccaceae bacterium]